MITRTAGVTAFASDGGEADETDVAHALRLVTACLPQRLCIRCYIISGDEWLPGLHKPCGSPLCTRAEDHHDPVTISIEVSL